MSLIQYQRIFIYQFNLNLNLLSYIYWNFCAKFVRIPRRYRTKQKWVFFIETLCRFFGLHFCRIQCGCNFYHCGVIGLKLPNSVK